MCDYSVITVTNTQTNPYPYTSTAMNGGVTAYQWISPQGIYYESGEAVAAWTEYGGDTSVISTGTWVTAQMASSLSQNVGTKTGDELYTSISNILESACPSVTAPTGTNTAEPVSCTEEPGYLDGITYIDDWNDFKKDGILNLSISISAYWDNTARQTLIEGISQLINGTSLQPANTKETSWECDTCLDDEDWPTVNLTNIPQLSQVIYSDDIHTSNLLLTTEFEVESNGAYVCAIDAFVIDAMGALALIPGLEWLGIVAGGGAGMSFACLDGELS